MHLNEQLKICLLALACRYPKSVIEIDEMVLGHHVCQIDAFAPELELEWLQVYAPQLLQSPAYLVIDPQQSAVYLLELSRDIPAFWIYCDGCSPGRTPLTGECAQATLRGRPRGRLGRVGSGKGCVRGRPRGRLGIAGSTPVLFRDRFGSRHRCRSDLIDEDLLNRPNMISQSCSHCRCTRASKMRGFAQFVMRKAEIVGASNQVHACF